VIDTRSAPEINKRFTGYLPGLDAPGPNNAWPPGLFQGCRLPEYLLRSTRHFGIGIYSR
jgi:hypothetical protein